MKKKRGRPPKPKAPEFSTEEGVLKFVDSMFDEKGGNKERARRKSNGATGGALPQLDSTIKKITASKAEPIPGSVMRNINETAQETRNNKNSISSLESRLVTLTEQSMQAFGMLGDLTAKFAEYKKETDKKLKDFEKVLTDSTNSGSGSTISDALGAASDIADMMPDRKAKTGKAASPVSKAKPGLLSQAWGAVKSGASAVGSSAIKGLSAAASFAGDTAIAGIKALDPKLASGIEKLGSKAVSGNFISRFLQWLSKSGGKVLAQKIITKVGVIAVGATVPLAGWVASLISTGLLIADAIELVGYLLDFIREEGDENEESAAAALSGKGPQESQAVKDARSSQTNAAGGATQQEESPGLLDRIGSFFGLKPTTKDAAKTTGNNTETNGPAGGSSSYSPADYKNDPEFTAELNRVASKFNVDANDMLAVMHSESGVRADIVNKGSGATGLIQFIPSTARSLGTSVEELRTMSRAQQMKYVEKYFDSVKLPNGATGGQIYASVFLPAFVNRKVLTTKGEPYYDANVGLDIDKDGKITMQDLDARVANMRSTYGLGTSTKKSAEGDKKPEQKENVPVSTPPVAGGGAGGTSQPDATPSGGGDTVGKAKSFAEGYKPSPGEGTEEAGKKLPGAEGVNQGMIQKLMQIQAAFGSLKVTSGYRNPQDNSRVGGAKNSAHMRANAVDVTFSGDEAKTLKLVEIASKAGIGGIGVYQPGFVHLDTESRRVWGRDYTPNSIPKWASGALSAHMSGEWGKYDASAQGGGPGQAGPKESAAPSGVASEGSSGGAPGGGLAALQGIIQNQGGVQQSAMPRSPAPGIPGIPAMFPQFGALASMINTFATGGLGSMKQLPITAIGGLLGSLLSPGPRNTRSDNPMFSTDQFQDNNVPSALPNAGTIRELFDMNIDPGKTLIERAFDA